MTPARAYNVSTAWLVSAVRLGAGLKASVAHLGKRPENLLELYEFEACPFCRKVREALSMLDLPALIRPCPLGGTRFRPEAERIGGKQQFPLLIDPNGANGAVTLYESADIVRYLAATYGDGTRPALAAFGPVDTLLSGMASAIRPRGRRARPGRAPAQPLELWSFEGSPFCRLVRETLCTLELPYVLHNVAKESPSRPAFVARSGRMMVPWLSDPNRGVEMFESADIIRYLEETYGA
jgi:glutathione S-transferase